MWYLAKWQYDQRIFICNEKSYIMQDFNVKKRIVIKITEKEKIFIEKIFDLKLLEDITGALGMALF